MKVATYLGAKTVMIDERPDVAPPAGHVQIAVEHVGLCGIDRQIYRGVMDDRVGPSAILGHEVCGRIAAFGSGTGPGVSTAPCADMAIGQLVTVLPFASCASCEACVAGRPHLCHRLAVAGVDSSGGLQERWNVVADSLVAMPAQLSSLHGALIEPAAIAVHALRRAPVTSGQRVLVVDSGPVGLFIALTARAAGAEVAVVEGERHRRIVARTSGLHVLDPAQDPIASYVRTWTKGGGVDLAFEVSGASLGVDTAIASLATRGRLVLVGAHSAPREVNVNRVLRRELSLVGASRYERTDVEQAVQMLTSAELPLELFFGASEPFDRVGHAFAALDAGDTMKIVVDVSDWSASSLPA